LFRLLADAQEQIIRSPYPDLLLEMAVIRMASLAPVIDAEDLLKAIGNAKISPAVANGGGSSTPPPAQVPPKPSPVSTPPTGAIRGAMAILASPAAEAGNPAAPETANLSDARMATAPGRQIRIEGEVKADAPRKSVGGPQDLPELRAFIRDRRAALAGFMEQGAILQLSDDLLAVTPRNDIYVRYLNDNRNVIAGLASEMYGRKIRVEMTAMAAPSEPPAAAISQAVKKASAEEDGAGGTVPESPSANGASGFQPKPQGSFKAAFAAAVETVATSDEVSAKPSGAAQAELKQAVYADPVVQRLFNEFQARLVEVRAQPSNPWGDGAALPNKR
jgi:hypothetical protein